MLKTIPAELVTDCFVETGTYHGDGIQIALSSGFKKVISIEINEKLYEESVRRFSGLDSINLYKGDSAKILYDCIKNEDCHMTFFLDGHYMDHNPAGECGIAFPIVEELEQIRKHHINKHTILIDDLRIINNQTWFEQNGWSFFGEGRLLEILREINPDYDIYRMDGVAPNDILIARI